MLELHARILSAAAIDSGVWLRGRFVGLLADQREAIAAFLRSLDRPALDAAAALAAIDALRAGDLLDESPRAGIAAPKLIPREKEWIAAGDPLATVTLARCRGSMVAAVLSTSPPRVLPAFAVWRDEIRRAREQLYAQPGAESDPALKEVGARLEHAARFLEAVADRADEAAADGEALGELPLVAPQAAPSRPAPEPRAPTRAERIPMWVLWAIATGSLLGIGAYLVHVLRG